MNFALFGNIAMDNYPFNPSKVKEELERKGKYPGDGKKVIYEDTILLIDDVAREQEMLLRAGGGAYNSLQAFLRFANGDRFVYYDFSANPGVRRDRRAVYEFRGLSEICNSLVIDFGGRRTTIKTQRYDKDVRIPESELERIAEIVKSSDAVFINSIANYQLAETLGRASREKEKYVVVTKNLSEEEIAQSKLIDGAVSILDIEEASVLGIKTSGEKAVLDSLYRLSTLGARVPVVTLEKDGVAYYNPEACAVRFCSTRPEVEGRVQRHVNENGILKTGAGDNFAAALSYFLAKGVELDEAVLGAQMFVIRHKLRFPEIYESDFQTKQVSEVIYDESGFSSGAGCKLI